MRVRGWAVAVGIAVATVISDDGYAAGGTLEMSYTATGATGAVTWLAGVVTDTLAAIDDADADTGVGGAFAYTLRLNEPGLAKVWIEARDAGTGTVARSVQTIGVHPRPDGVFDADADIGLLHRNRLLRCDTTSADVTLTITDGPGGAGGLGGYLIENHAGANDVIVTVPVGSGWTVEGVVEDSFTFGPGEWGWVMPDNYLGFNAVKSA